MILVLNLGAATPIETEWPILAQWETKSSLLKHQWYLGLRHQEFWTRWRNWWNFITLWNNFRSSDWAQLFSQVYSCKNVVAKLMDMRNSPSVRKGPALSQRKTSWTRDSNALIIWLWQFLMLFSSIFFITCRRAGASPLHSPPFASKKACCWCGAFSLVNIDILKFVSCVPEPCCIASVFHQKLYWAFGWMWSPSPLTILVVRPSILKILWSVLGFSFAKRLSTSSKKNKIKECVWKVSRSISAVALPAWHLTPPMRKT